MYYFAVQRLNINSITHKYLVKGHTQNEGDTVHSIIEGSLKRAKKSGPIYVPEQYVSLIRSAKKSGAPLRVREMNFGDFFDLKILYDEMALNLSKDVDGNDFKINEVRQMRFEKGSDELRYKSSYQQVTWNIINLKPSKRRRFIKRKLISDIKLQPAYTKRITISDNKVRDLKSLINNNIIPSFYKTFYDSIF